jgi:hypothetical protein
MTLGSTQSLAELSIRNLPGGKGLPAFKLTTSQSCVSRLSGICGSLDVSQSCGTPWSVTRINLPFFLLPIHLGPQCSSFLSGFLTKILYAIPHLHMLAARPTYPIFLDFIILEILVGTW